MRKIKYKKGRKIQPSYLEYTGIHKDKSTEMQLFVYNDLDLIEFENFHVSALHGSIDLKKIKENELKI